MRNLFFSGISLNIHYKEKMFNIEEEILRDPYFVIRNYFYTMINFFRKSFKCDSMFM